MDTENNTENNIEKIEEEIKNKNMNKKYLILVVIVVVMFVLFVISKIAVAPPKEDVLVDKDKEGDITEVFSQDEMKKIRNAIVEIPELETPARLFNGEAEFELVGTPIRGYIVMGDTFAVYKATTTLVAGKIAVNGGGSGIFEYAVLYRVDDGYYTHVSSAFIGDRVSITGMSFVEKGQSAKGSVSLKVDFLDRGEGDAFAEIPTISSTKMLDIINNSFVESK